jgi:hypothetical protein
LVKPQIKDSGRGTVLLSFSRNTSVGPGDASTFGQPLLRLSIHLLISNELHLFRWDAPGLSEPPS